MDRETSPRGLARIVYCEVDKGCERTFQSPKKLGQSKQTQHFYGFIMVELDMGH